ncbi:MAG: DUF6247 family protein [Mycobacteriales bacterium]
MGRAVLFDPHSNRLPFAAASPAEIRAALVPEERSRFDREYRQALEVAAGRFRRCPSSRPGSATDPAYRVATDEQSLPQIDAPPRSGGVARRLAVRRREDLEEHGVDVGEGLDVNSMSALCQPSLA